MSRYDSHVAKLKRQADELEDLWADEDFVAAWALHGKTGELPKKQHRKLRAKVLLFAETVRYMFDTVPRPDDQDEYEAFTTQHEREVHRMDKYINGGVLNSDKPSWWPKKKR